MHATSSDKDVSHIPAVPCNPKILAALLGPSTPHPHVPFCLLRPFETKDLANTMISYDATRSRAVCPQIVVHAEHGLMEDEKPQVAREPADERRSHVYEAAAWCQLSRVHNCEVRRMTHS